jgi:hypothetical protein
MVPEGGAANTVEVSAPSNSVALNTSRNFILINQDLDCAKFGKRLSGAYGSQYAKSIHIVSYRR